MKLTALVLALALSGCSGHAKPMNICLQPSDRIVAMHGCDAVIQPIEEPDPVESVRRQAALGDTVILWLGRDRAAAIRNFMLFIREAKKYPNIKWVYVVDEFDSCGYGCIAHGRDDALVNDATRVAHANGLKTIITITPTVVFDPAFVLPHVDGIAVDAYPAALGAPADLGDCRYNNNPLANQVYCAGKKLRAMGHTGMYGWPFQAFGATTDSEAMRMSQLTMQRKAINDAAAMGVDAVMAWGCHLGVREIQDEPWLVPLCGTKYEAMVQP